MGRYNRSSCQRPSPCSLRPSARRSPTCGGIFDLDQAESRIKALEQALATPGFWDDPSKANPTIQELKRLKSVSEPWAACWRELQTLEELSALIEKEDTASLEDLNRSIAALSKEAAALESKTLFRGESDPSNAIVSIAAGAGGTESCDWVSMLFRMYSRWAETRGFGKQVIDYLAGEEAGIKSVTVEIQGDYAFGWLQGEAGVHRLVRISPFDSNKRRHTSFAAVDVIPEIPDDIAVDLQEKDLRIDVYRASGPGGQGVNTTDSAVRITHLPTGLVVQCQNERSQHKNKAFAMKVLRARLHELERKRREEELARQHEKKQKIEWGSQIRSYVLQPYQMVKDHRTEVETGKTQAILNGEELDIFLDAYLRWKAQRK
ncbi:MAG: peptide chain release factor 2 [Candidatus Omnitrophica bacterium]|nr:peptide chain release factor 2 [Candidatus Omnitrophota bacterium]